MYDPKLARHVIKIIHAKLRHNSSILNIYLCMFLKRSFSNSSVLSNYGSLSEVHGAETIVTAHLNSE